MKHKVFTFEQFCCIWRFLKILASKCPSSRNFQNLRFFNTKSFLFLRGFFCLVFLSQTLRIWDSMRREENVLIRLYHFHPFTNIQTFISNFASKVTSYLVFLITVHFPSYYSMRFIHLLKLAPLVIAFKLLSYARSDFSNFSQKSGGFEFHYHSSIWLLVLKRI